MIVKAIICDNNKYLIAQIGCGQFTGLWDFVGGPIAGDEIPEIRLKEYVEDIVGLEVNVGELLIRKEVKPASFYSTEFYLCEVVSGTLNMRGMSHRIAKWVKKEDLRSFQWESTNLVALDVLLK